MESAIKFALREDSEADVHTIEVLALSIAPQTNEVKE